MKINSINSINTFGRPGAPRSFKHTAVPYPEYENAYIYDSSDNKGFFGKIAEKISDLFNPAVSKEAKDIKSQIDTIFGEEPKEQPQIVLVA